MSKEEIEKVVGELVEQELPTRPNFDQIDFGNHEAPGEADSLSWTEIVIRLTEILMDSDAPASAQQRAKNMLVEIAEYLEEVLAQEEG